MNQEDYKAAWKSLFFSKTSEDVILPVLSGSMYPLIRKDDLLRVQPCKAGAIHQGDIMVFRIGHKISAHRVILKISWAKKIWIIEKGDQNKYPGLVKPEQVLGRVLQILRNDQKYSMEESENRSIQRKKSRWQLLSAMWQLLIFPFRLIKANFKR